MATLDDGTRQRMQKIPLLKVGLPVALPGVDA